MLTAHQQREALHNEVHARPYENLTAPLLLGFVLGPMMEENLRRALLLSRGDPLVFVHRPISAGLLIAAVLLVLLIGLPNIRKKREEAFVEAEA